MAGYSFSTQCKSAAFFCSRFSDVANPNKTYLSAAVICALLLSSSWERCYGMQIYLHYSKYVLVVVMVHIRLLSNVFIHELSVYAQFALCSFILFPMLIRAWFFFLSFYFYSSIFLRLHRFLWNIPCKSLLQFSSPTVIFLGLLWTSGNEIVQHEKKKFDPS